MPVQFFPAKYSSDGRLLNTWVISKPLLLDRSVPSNRCWKRFILLVHMNSVSGFSSFLIAAHFEANCQFMYLAYLRMRLSRCRGRPQMVAVSFHLKRKEQELG